MLDLRNSILATLAYYDIFEYPLTAVEIHKYLINPARLDRAVVGVPEISLGQVANEIYRLAEGGRIVGVLGFYGLDQRTGAVVTERLERQKIAEKKYKKLLRLARWFQLVPFVRGMFVSGSLALDNSAPGGDFDIFTVVKAGHLYTTRILLLCVATLLRVRRTRHDEEAPDKFCFNHYIGDDQLALEHASIYTAHTYAQLIPIFMQNQSDEAFFSANSWINKYLFNFKPSERSLRRKVPHARMRLAIARGLEFLLNTSAGEEVERLAKSYQQARIKKNPVTNETGGRIIFTDSHLELHPRSFETVVIRRYNEALGRLGIAAPAQEQDSGLRMSV